MIGRGGDNSKIKPAKIIHYLKKIVAPPLINKIFAGLSGGRRTGAVGGNPRSGFLPARRRRAGSQSASRFC